MNETIASIIEPFTTESIMRVSGVSKFVVYSWRKGSIPSAHYIGPLGELTHRTLPQMLSAAEASAAKITARKAAKNKKPTKNLTKVSAKPSRREAKEKVPA